jgi:hypothetical protein
MAFNQSNMVLIGHGAGNHVYFYKTSEALATAVAADYFLPYYEQLKENDVIVLVAGTGGTETVDLLVVSASSSATVTVTNGT